MIDTTNVPYQGITGFKVYGSHTEICRNFFTINPNVKIIYSQYWKKMALINHIIYVVFYTLLRLLVEIKSQTTNFKPDLREGHTTTFINDRLYILGGAIPPFTDNKAPQIGTFFYLDCSVPFITNELKWIDLSNNNIVPSHRYAESGASNNTLFLYGGESLGESMSPVYTFNTLSNTWSVPIITGTSPIGKEGMTSIVDNNGLMYLYSGGIGRIYAFDMTILDTINLSWKEASLIDAPSSRVQYGAALLLDKSILYMGM